MWELFQQLVRHPVLLIAPTLNAIFGGMLGYYAAIRGKWLVTLPVMIAGILMGSATTVWGFRLFSGNEPWTDYTHAVVATALGLSVPAVLPYFLAWMVSNMKPNRRAVIGLVTLAGLVGILAYPLWAIWCDCVVYHDYCP
jgi:hypothetical protein